MIERLSKKVPRRSLKKFAEGIVLSKLRYCLAIFGSVMIGDRYREEGFRSAALSKKDLLALQVILNRLARLLTGEGKRVSTKLLMEKAGLLSVQQEIAKSRMMMILDMMFSGKPKMLADMIRIESWEHVTRNMDQVKQPNYRLSLSKSSVLYQGCSLVNRWGRAQTKTMSKSLVKIEIKKWIKEEIPTKPVLDNANSRRTRRQTRREQQREAVQVQNIRSEIEAGQPRIDVMFQRIRSNHEDDDSSL